ncbi:hypothetical protein K440DRAFT_549882 [Wilcoxina mikolae CBS 423.85]|nr:hypothetical protein K440DRAFT_549882 [Wilcoxina mikolae CBS 423.85]
MAPPGFGFSVGDFIGAIGLITKICKALQDTGGAASEYQHVILELRSLERVLIHLAALEPTDENANHVNAIRGMALACQLPLREFLTKLEKYEVSLGPFAARNAISGAGRKTKWAVCMSEEVSKLRAIVAAKVLSINLLLSTHTSQTVSRVESQGRKYHSEHQNGLEEIKTRVEEVGEEVTKGFKEARTNDITRIKVESEINTRMRSLEVNAKCNTSQLEAISSSTQSIRSSIVSLRGVGEQLKQFLSSFPVEVRDMLRAILQTNFQIYNLLHAQTVAQSPTLLLQDNIRFEDALGVVRELPYEWFRDWEVQ